MSSQWCHDESGNRALQQRRHPTFLSWNRAQCRKGERASAGVRVGIGSDWSPSGSKNLLGQIEVAWLVAQQIGGVARPDIIAMATRTAAKILGWGSVLGTLEAGKPHLTRSQTTRRRVGGREAFLINVAHK